MGYKQDNNPFNRKISSPLRHNVRDKKGNPWVHQHDGGNVTGKVAGNVIKGDMNFGGDKKDKKIKGVSETEAAMAYANQIANNYNTGALVGGNFRADDYDKWKSYDRGGSKPKSFLGKLTGIDIYRGYNDGKVNVDFGKKKKGFTSSSQFNVQQGEWDGETGAYKNVPTEQVTPEQIYDMMVQGGGMVSIVDGKIVAGNPNQDTTFSDFRSDQGKTNYGINAIPSGYEFISPPKKRKAEYYDRRGNIVPGTSNYSSMKIVPNENYDAQMAEYNKFYDQRSDSPLNQGHETDERSNQAREGFVYTPGEEKVTTRTEEEYGPNGELIGYRDYTDTTVTNTGTRNTPGTTKVITDEPNETPPNWDDCYKNGVFQTGAIVGEGVNAIKCELKPNPGPNPGGEPIIEDTQPVTEEHVYDDVTTESVFRPIEVEEKLIPPPSLDLGVPGSIKSRGGSFKLPSVDLSELIKLPQGWFEPKSAGGGRGCGCMVNPR